MSLLEDVFLEDEANEAQELERIIEGDDDGDQVDREVNSENNSEREDEAEEEKVRVEPSSKVKRVAKNPRFVLNPARLTGPRGIQVIPDHFKDFKFKGKGHEGEDLDLVLKKLEHWAYRLYPKFQFEDCLKKIETLGKKRPVMVHLHKIRSDQLLTEETVVQRDSSDDEAAAQQEPEEDEFDKLLDQQIQLARAAETPFADKRSPLMMPKATSSPSISEEQRERMMRNRRLAEERRLARLKGQNTNDSNLNIDLTNNGRTESTDDVSESVNIDLTADNGRNESNATKDTARKNRSNVIVSSDDDDDAESNTILVSKVTVDIHENAQKDIDFSSGYNNNDKNDATNINDEIGRKKHNKSHAIDSSDDDDDVTMNQVVTVDVHNKNTEIDVSHDSDDVQDEEITKTNEMNQPNEGMVEQNNDILTENIEECRPSTESTETSEKNNETEKQVIAMTIESTKEIDGSNKSPAAILNTQTCEVVSQDSDIENIETLKSGDNNTETVNAENAGDNATNSEVLDDLMDVDFSDDF